MAALLVEKANGFVFTVVEGKAKKVPVKTGFIDETHAEIVSGITPEDLAILAGQQSLRDGQPVRVADTK